MDKCSRQASQFSASALICHIFLAKSKCADIDLIHTGQKNKLIHLFVMNNRCAVFKMPLNMKSMNNLTHGVN